MENKLCEKVEHFLSQVPLLEGDSLLVAVSGGRDSMALLGGLHLLWNKRTLPPVSLAVVHYNHQSRGEDSLGDEAFVLDYVKHLETTLVLDSQKQGEKEQEWGSKQRNIPCFVGRSDVQALADARKQGFEETARQVRYEFFQEVAKELSASTVSQGIGEFESTLKIQKSVKTEKNIKSPENPKSPENTKNSENINNPENPKSADVENSADHPTKHRCYILTAHHAQDNVETLLLHLARGSGLQGLGGIPPQRGNILRPLLQVTPEEIQTFVQSHGIPFRQDISNWDEKYRRNFVRHQVLPSFKELNSQYLTQVNHTISIIRQEHEWLKEWVAEQLPLTQEGERVSCQRNQWKKLPPALRCRGLQHLASGKEYALSQRQLTQVEAMLLQQRPSTVFSLGQGLQIRRNYDTLYIEPCTPVLSSEQRGEVFGMFHAEEPFFRKTGESKELATIVWNRWQCTLSYGMYQKQSKGNPWVLWLKETTAVTTLTFRSRQIGDSLRLKGRPEKTVKKWCIEEKIPKIDRDSLPVCVLPSSNQLVAVGGLGTHEPFLPQEGEMGWCIQCCPLEER